MRVDEVLDAAADYIEVHGHTKLVYGGRNNGPACASGAIDSVLTKNNLIYHSDLFTTARQALVDSLGGYDSIVSIPEWNDKPERTKQEVVDAMRHAAEELRNG